MATARTPNGQTEAPMSRSPETRDHRRHRLATNDNEIVAEDENDTEGHRLATNDTETTVEDAREPETTVQK